MSETTKIEWASASWSPWEGCTKVSPGCAHCYAEALNHRFGKDNWGPGKSRRRMSADYWKQPVKWNRDEDHRPQTADHRPRIFPSLCDWLDEEVPVAVLADFLKLIHDTPNLDWLLLTKRPENWRDRLLAARNYGLQKQGELSVNGVGGGLAAWWEQGNALANVRLGVSVENQRCADERIPELLKIPAGVRFLSVEPLLEAVDLPAAFRHASGECQVSDFACRMQQSHEWEREHGRGGWWVIVGGESGPGARPCNVEWIRGVVSQCRAAGVPCFVKQLGSNVFADPQKDLLKFVWDAHSHRINDCRRILLKHPKGGDPAEWPADLRVRQFPEVRRL